MRDKTEAMEQKQGGANFCTLLKKIFFRFVYRLRTVDLQLGFLQI